MNLLARIVSYVFHPMLVGTYLFAFMVFMLPAALYPVAERSQLLFLALFFTITCVLPVFMLSILKALGSLKSFTMKTRQERIFPFFMMVVLYGSFTYMMLRQNNGNFEGNVIKFLLIIDCLVLVGTLVTLFFKVSIHAIGMMGLVGILIPLNRESDNVLLLWVTLGVIVLAGIVMSARLQLNAHTPRQILAGALSGFLIGFLGVIVLF